MLLTSSTKMGSNTESTVGIMTTAAESYVSFLSLIVICAMLLTHSFFYERGPEVLVTHTKDLGQVIKIRGVHIATVKIGRYMVVQTAIAVGKLALKRRETKNLRQRIIVFVASPLDGPEADGKFSKNPKNNNGES